MYRDSFPHFSADRQIVTEHYSLFIPYYFSKLVQFFSGLSICTIYSTLCGRTLLQKLIVAQLVKNSVMESFHYCMRFQILTKLTIKIIVALDVTPCSIINYYRRFG
jgi:hypothetical protein